MTKAQRTEQASDNLVVLDDVRPGWRVSLAQCKVCRYVWTAVWHPLYPISACPNPECGCEKEDNFIFLHHYRGDEV
jgi:hypothetical protein